MIDTQAIKEHINLAAMVEADLGPPEKRSGGKLFWRCPFHDETDPSFVVFPDGGFYCFGCGQHGDVIAYVQKRRGLSFRDACRFLAGRSPPTDDTRTAPGRRRSPLRVADPPPQGWQDAAAAVMRDCANVLFSHVGRRARACLNARGLQDGTLARWHVGFNDADRERHGLYVRRGIVVPHCHQATGHIWALKIRRAAGQPKYVNVKGSTPHLWGVDNLAGHDVAFVCEGEFDGLLLWQEVGDLVAVVAQGGAAHHDLDTWLPYLVPLKRLYIATDNDDAGCRAAAYWRTQTGRARRVLPPAGQVDITDAWQAGADLRRWVLQIVRRGSLTEAKRAHEQQGFIARQERLPLSFAEDL